MLALEKDKTFMIYCIVGAVLPLEHWKSPLCWQNPTLSQIIECGVNTVKTGVAAHPQFVDGRRHQTQNSAGALDPFQGTREICLLTVPAVGQDELFERQRHLLGGGHQDRSGYGRSRNRIKRMKGRRPANLTGWRPFAVPVRGLGCVINFWEELEMRFRPRERAWLCHRTLGGIKNVFPSP